MAKMLEQGPVLVLAFQAQQLTRKKPTQETSVEAVSLGWISPYEVGMYIAEPWGHMIMQPCGSCEFNVWDWISPYKVGMYIVCAVH